MDRAQKIALAHELLDRIEAILDSWITQLNEGWDGIGLEDGYGIS